MMNTSVSFFLLLLRTMPNLSHTKQIDNYSIMPLRITLKQLKIWSPMTFIAQLALIKHLHPTFVLNYHILKLLQLLLGCLLINGLALMTKQSLHGTFWMTKLNPSSLAILQQIRHQSHPHISTSLPIDHHF